MIILASEIFSQICWSTFATYFMIDSFKILDPPLTPVTYIDPSIDW